MKLDKLIEILQAIKSREGDKDVVLFDYQKEEAYEIPDVTSIHERVEILFRGD